MDKDITKIVVVSWIIVCIIAFLIDFWIGIYCVIAPVIMIVLGRYFKSRNGE